jgi:hypothetical protein
MTARVVKASGAREGNGEGLRGSRIHTAGQGILGDIMTPKRPTAPWIAREKRLSIPGSVIKSSERPTAVVGRGPSRKSRLKGMVPLAQGIQLAYLVSADTYRKEHPEFDTDLDLVQKQALRIDPGYAVALIKTIRGAGQIDKAGDIFRAIANEEITHEDVVIKAKEIYREAMRN